MTRYDAPQKNSDLIYRLRGLAIAGAILHIGAHPDDEDVGMLAYMARKFGLRIVYWSATRGEGGQNRIGPDRSEALGVYRTWESLAARAVDGGEALFGPFYDFGYSKSGDETLAKWGGAQLVTAEIVRAIRLVQPQIVVGRWAGDPTSDGHGHHQAVGAVTAAAFKAAGDPACFPELQAQGLPPWQAQRLYYSTGGDWQPGEEGGTFGAPNPAFEQDGYVRINSGEFDPIANRTYQEQAWIGFNNHKTQAMGFVPERERFFYYYRLAENRIPVSPGLKTDFYEGLDPSLTGLAHYPGNESATLLEQLEVIKDKAQTALAQFRADDAAEAGVSLLEGAALLRALWSEPVVETLTESARQALVLYLTRKKHDFEEAAAHCLGFELECLADYARVTPTQRFRVKTRFWNPRNVHLHRAKFTFNVPPGWEIEHVDGEDSNRHPDRPEALYDVTVPSHTPLDCPYWLIQPRNGYRYHWPEHIAGGLPFDAPLVRLNCEVALGEHELTLSAPAIFREGFPGGFRELPVAVVPPISLQPKVNQEMLRVSCTSQTIGLQAVAYSNIEWAGVEGNLWVETPPDWQVEPAEITLSLGKTGDSQTVNFKVTIPENTVAGVYPLRYVVQCQGRDYDVVLKPVRMGAAGLPHQPDESTCIREQFITTPAINNIHLIDVAVTTGLKYAYIQGAVEDVLTALARFELDIHVISDEELGYIDLNQFDAIVIGPNAYLIRDALRKNATRLPRYVEQGGTLLVQYQGYGYQRDEFVPYPFKYSQPHDRVTFEDAPVSFLEADHFLFHQPNKISDTDFEGWVHDRGMYFFGQWDKRYTPLLACNDPGESPRMGGLMITSYGRGTFIYAAYSFFRQLPAGVPGAFRLFANLLATPMALILARAEFLKNVALFGSMDEEQLQTVARIMTEQWVKDGVYLCHQGDEGGEMFIIVQGEVEIIKESKNSADQIIYVARAGEAIGEMEVLGKGYRTAAMRARGDIQLLNIQGDHFRKLIHRHPDMLDQVITMLMDKLAAAGVVN
jgi:LmbE family N-acetylglucosaminyl deacetylase